MQIVTGYEGAPHVTSWQDRDLNQGIFGDGTYILNVGSKLAATIVSNNQINIADGAVMMQGCLGVIQKGTSDSVAIDNGAQGMQRRDLICAQYSKNGSTGVESMSLVVVKGTPSASSPADPSYTTGDIQNGASLVQEPLYRVNLNGLTVTSVEALVDEQRSMGDVNEELTTVANEVGAIGQLYKTYYTNVPIPQNSFTTVASVAVPAGTYIVSGYVDFTNVTSGYMRAIRISPLGDDAPASGDALMNVVSNHSQTLNACFVVKYSTATTIDLLARHQQNAGTITGCSALLCAVRIA